jgi:hypothetical protein
MKLKPVTLPPGRARLATNPDFTGSATRIITTGTVEVAFFAVGWAGSKVMPKFFLAPVRRIWIDKGSINAGA